MVQFLSSTTFADCLAVVVAHLSWLTSWSSIFPRRRLRPISFVIVQKMRGGLHCSQWTDTRHPGGQAAAFLIGQAKASIQRFCLVTESPLSPRGLFLQLVSALSVSLLWLALTLSVVPMSSPSSMEARFWLSYLRSSSFPPCRVGRALLAAEHVPCRAAVIIKDV